MSEQLLVAREIEFRLDAAPKVLACVLCHRDIDFDDALEKGRWLNEPENVQAVSRAMAIMHEWVVELGI